MGKGDKKTRKGKIIMGSYGVTRPQKKGNGSVPTVMKKESEEQAPSPSKPKAPRKPKEE